MYLIQSVYVNGLISTKNIGDLLGIYACGVLYQMQVVIEIS